MRIDAVCTPCGGVVIKGSHWSRAETTAAIHRASNPGHTVRVVAVFTRGQWSRLHPDFKARAGDGTRSVLHLDSDGATILVPAVVMGRS